jgi:uncharacterized protein YjbI with pentapeptide repeats
LLPWSWIRSNHESSRNYIDAKIAQNTTATIDSGSKNAHINNITKIVIDDPAEEDALDFERYSQNLANIIRVTDPKFAIGIFGKWGTGKTTLMKMIKNELEKDENTSNKILTVWFDAWRYEREKNLAVIPFLRQIRIELENDLARNRKTKKWKVVRESLERTFTAFIESTQISFTPAGSPISATTNLEQVVGSLKSKGSTYIDGERIQFHEHSTDYLKTALDKLYNNKDTKGARIVVFVDDLDRCTPEKALEVIESIKAFFDIRGIVYVIGMDWASINHIIKEKYGDKPNIEGIDYLEKIVQLPFEIPDWKAGDISKFLTNIVRKGLKGSDLETEFDKPDTKNLIALAIQPNPRQAKRFINRVILARSVFSKFLPDSNIDKLIVVQALNFRREWNMFSKLITLDETRKTFFKKYYIPQKEADKVINSKESLDKLKDIDDDKKPPPKAITDIFQELLNQKDDTLRSFLDAGGAKILLDIDEMEKYRRAVEATEPKEEQRQQMSREQGPTNEELLELLKTGKVEQFNNSRIEHTTIYPDLSNANLSKANLSNANLSKANLSNADLTGTRLKSADLSYVNLSGADLSNASLSNASLSNASLSNARLVGANFSRANLSNADLTGAILVAANLSNARLTDANLSGADLSNAGNTAFLLGGRPFSANLSNANLSNANLSDANLTNARLIDADLSNANLSDANLTNARLIDANLSDANLTNARLIDADLSWAKISNANLSNADLSGANLAHSIIIGLKFVDSEEFLLCKDANFNNAIIDDDKLSKHLRSIYGKNVPDALENKKELKKKLEHRGRELTVRASADFENKPLPEGLINELLSSSSLPE